MEDKRIMYESIHLERLKKIIEQLRSGVSNDEIIEELERILARVEEDKKKRRSSR